MAYRVAVLYAPELDVGGVEESLKAMFRLGDSDIEWFVLAPASARFVESTKASGVRFVLWRPKKIWDPSALFGLIGYFRQHKISLAHINSPEVSVIAKLAAWLSGIPSVITIHLSPSEYFQGTSFVARFKKGVYLWVDALLSYIAKTHIIFNSKQTKAIEIKKFPYSLGRTHIVYNGADVTGFSAEKKNRITNRKIFDVGPETTVISFVGRLEKQKGLDLLLRAFHMVSQTHSNLRLWIIGAGSKLQDIMDYIEENKMENVVLWGSREDVAKLLSASDVFVLPSQYETMPIALLEAMAVGVASIATAVGENNLIINNGVNGLLIPTESVAEIVQALVRLIEDPGLRSRLGKAGADTVTQFSLERMVAGVMDVYQAALKQPKS